MPAYRWPATWSVCWPSRVSATSARALGGDIKLANLTQRVGDQLQITKLVTVFEVFDSEEKAVTSYKTAATA